MTNIEDWAMFILSTRTENGLSQEAFAAAVGASVYSVKSWESKRREWPGPSNEEVRQKIIDLAEKGVSP